MPYWLCVDDLDDISSCRDEFTAAYDSFLQVFAAAEKTQNKHHSTPLTDAMQHAWQSGAHWVFYCFTSANAMAIMVQDHRFPFFGFRTTVKEEEEAFAHHLSHFWCPNSEQFTQRKMADKEQYDLDLQAHYETAASHFAVAV